MLETFCLHIKAWYEDTKWEIYKFTKLKCRNSVGYAVIQFTYLGEDCTGVLDHRGFPPPHVPWYLHSLDSSPTPGRG